VRRESPLSTPTRIVTGIRKTRSHTSSKKPKTSTRATVTKESEYDKRTEQFAGVRLTSPEKILYPHEGITKLEFAAYYQTMAEWILPHIGNRPLVLTRCPDGQENSCFYQKHPGPGTPETFKRFPIREKTKTDDYVIVDDVAGLISLAQIGSLEIHAWGSRTDKLEFPDRLIFDLDPDPKLEWKDVVHSARQVRAFLQELGLESFVKTTGGKGLHLVVPIDRRHEWDEAKTFCKQVAEAIVSADPRHYTATMSKAARHGKIFIDYFRNDRGATAVIPYSPRARPRAPVSVPLAWDELSTRIRSDHFTIRTIAKRLASLRQDPWKGMASHRQGLGGASKALQRVTGS
jgi:bifunctional non-homologous end joining protein LigD